MVMFWFRRTILLCVCYSTAATAASATASTTSPNVVSTCPARTLNYITHTLHQQCLTATRNAGGGQGAYNETSATESGTPYDAVNPHNSSNVVQSYDTTGAVKEDHQVTSTALASTRPLSESSISVTTVTAISLTSTLPVPALIPDATDDDPLLETGSFLSFEEWKKQNLIKVGQSEHVGRDNGYEAREPRKRPSNVHNSLDSLGDDAEIDLDFSGLVPGGPGRVEERSAEGAAAQPSESAKTANGEAHLKTKSRSKDAGTTCKERSNYASFDCAANVLKSNSRAKSSTSVLVENKDSYMLNICSADDKFIILELCNDISIDTIALANFEFFSSTFRQFHVGVSDRYPVKADKWKSLGTFEARNTRDIQAFLVENPVIWARYIKIDFLTHYGNEYYCPVSLIRVHGTTMMQEYKHDMETNIDEDDDEDEGEGSNVANTESPLVDTPTPDVVDQKAQHDAMHSETEITSDALTNTVNSSQEAVSDPGPAYVLDAIYLANGSSSNPSSNIKNHLMLPTTVEMCPAEQAYDQEALVDEPEDLVGTEAYTPSGALTSQSSTVADALSTSKVSLAAQGPTDSLGAATTTQVHSKGDTSKEQTSSGGHTAGATSRSTSSSTSSSSNARSSTSTAERVHSPATSSDRVKQSTSTTQAHPASPTMQESFFRLVQKRLQMLESNSSLSLQYIEEQSKALREAFRKIEQRQLLKTSTFLEHLNATVLSELREFRQQYDHLWQSTVIELELQREQYQRENQAIHARLGILADELIFQKRMTILQMVLILVCLGLVLFSRGAINNYLELPLVQSVLSKSPKTRWMNVSNGATPTSPQINRPRSAHQLVTGKGILKRHQRVQSDDSNTAASEVFSPSDIYSPPTPVSFEGFSDPEHSNNDGNTSGDPDFDPATIERPSTSPPMLPSTDDALTPRVTAGFDIASIESRILNSPYDTGHRSGLATPEIAADETKMNPKHLKWDLPRK